MRVFVLVFALSAAGVAATFARYGSLHPCDWLLHDMVDASDMPEIWVETRIRARFFLDGVSEPGVVDCLDGWWTFRIEEIDKLDAVE